RLAFGPGRAVLIFGPAKVFVVIGSSENQSLVFRRWSWPRRGRNTASAEPQMGGSVTSHYQKDWGANEKAAPPDSVWGTRVT
ncbi:MAG TPA: hypothetical protein VGV15_16860, partial [Terriglobales bacterium]|nr:hypothetical protein [Terriglobales bacterium]